MGYKPAGVESAFQLAADVAAVPLQAGGPDAMEAQPDLVRVAVQKGREARLGSRLVCLELPPRASDLVLTAIKDSSIIDRWNKANPSSEVMVGDVLVEVSGITEPMAMLNKLTNFTEAELVFHRSPARDKVWTDQVARLCEMADRESGQAENAQRGCVRSIDGGRGFHFSGTVRAGDVGVDCCSICLENVEDGERLVQLRCGHAFHCSCIARWMKQQGSRCVCPLCIRAVR